MTQKILRTDGTGTLLQVGQKNLSNILRNVSSWWLLWPVAGVSSDPSQFEGTSCSLSQTWFNQREANARVTARYHKSTLEWLRHLVWREGCLSVRQGSWQVVQGCRTALTHHSVAYQRDWVLFCHRLVRKKNNPHNDCSLQNVPPCI